MRKRVILPGALRAIRSLKAERDPKFRSGTFGPACGVSEAHIINIEKGRRGASEELLVTLAAKLDVSVDAISYLSPAEVAVA